MRLLSTAGSCATVVLALQLTAAPALAEDAAAQAASHFDAGSSLYQSGRMRDAAVEFLKAYRLAPHVDALFNAGLSLEGSGDSAAAATAYAWCLDGDLRPEIRSDAQARFQRLSAELGSVVVKAPKGATVEHSVMSVTEFPAVFFVLPGEALFTVTQEDGRISSRRTRVSRGGRVHLTFGRLAPTPSQTLEASQTKPDRPLAAGEPSSPFPWRTVGIVGMGVGVGLGLGAFGLRQATLSARDDYVASGNTDPDARDRALSLNTWTNVALVSAVVVGAAGVTVFVLEPGPRKEVSLRVAPAGAALQGRF